MTLIINTLGFLLSAFVIPSLHPLQKTWNMICTCQYFIFTSFFLNISLPYFSNFFCKTSSTIFSWYFYKLYFAHNENMFYILVYFSVIMLKMIMLNRFLFLRRNGVFMCLSRICNELITKFSFNIGQDLTRTHYLIRISLLNH